MAKEEFDFNALQELNIPKYLKEYAKPAIVKKAKAAVCFVDLKMNKASKKTSFIIIPCKKMPEAVELFKQVKAEKLHPLKKVALVNFSYDGKTNKVTVEPKKGGIANELLSTRGEEFFETNYQWGFELVGTEDNKEASVASESAADTAPSKGKKLTTEQKQKMKENMDTMQSKIDELTKKLGIS